MTNVDTTFNPQTLFPNFYNNMAVKVIAEVSRWTVSGRLDEGSNGKAPIDMRHLLDMGRVRGAWARDEQCLVTLDELTSRLPDAANAAYYLRAPLDGLMVIDIEPECPAEVSAQLLQLPETIYAEVSMSGRGYHLMVPLPRNFVDHPKAMYKKVLRHEKGWYEILLEHWCTFTRNPISKTDAALEATGRTPEEPYTSTASLYESLAASARSSSAHSTEIQTPVDPPSIVGSDEIVSETLDGADSRLKTLEDFDNDTSRWEFSILGTLLNEMRRHLVVIGYLKSTRYSDSDIAWLLYLAAVEVLPPRNKHRERRNGRPFLLDRAAAMVAANSKRSEGSTE